MRAWEILKYQMKQKQYIAAQKMGMNTVRLNQILNLKMQPHPTEIEKLVKFMRKDEAELLGACDGIGEDLNIVRVLGEEARGG